MAKKLLSLVIIFNLVFPSYAFGEGEEAPTEEQATYDVISLKKGEPAPFDGVFFSTAAAAKIAVDKKFEDAECDLRIGYELHLQQERLESSYRVMLAHLAILASLFSNAATWHQLRNATASQWWHAILRLYRLASDTTGHHKRAFNHNDDEVLSLVGKPLQ